MATACAIPVTYGFTTTSGFALPDAAPPHTKHGTSTQQGRSLFEPDDGHVAISAKAASLSTLNSLGSCQTAALVPPDPTALMLDAAFSASSRATSMGWEGLLEISNAVGESGVLQKTEVRPGPAPFFMRLACIVSKALFRPYLVHQPRHPSCYIIIDNWSTTLSCCTRRLVLRLKMRLRTPGAVSVWFHTICSQPQSMSYREKIQYGRRSRPPWTSIGLAAHRTCPPPVANPRSRSAAPRTPAAP